MKGGREKVFAEIRSRLSGNITFNDWYHVLAMLMSSDDPSASIETCIGYVKGHSSSVPNSFRYFTLHATGGLFINNPRADEDDVWLGSVNKKNAAKVLVFAKKIDLLFTYVENAKEAECDIVKLDTSKLLYAENCTITSSDDGIAEAMDYEKLEELFIWMAEIGIMSGIEVHLHDYSKFSDNGLRKIFSKITHLIINSHHDQCIQRLSSIDMPELRALQIKNTPTDVDIHEMVNRMSKLQCYIVKTANSHDEDYSLMQEIRHGRIPSKIKGMSYPFTYTPEDVHDLVRQITPESIEFPDYVFWLGSSAERLHSNNFGESGAPIDVKNLFIEASSGDCKEYHADAVFLLMSILKKFIQNGLQVLSLPGYVYEKISWLGEDHPELKILIDVSMFDYYLQQGESQ